MAANAADPTRTSRAGTNMPPTSGVQVRRGMEDGLLKRMGVTSGKEHGRG